MNFGFKFNFGQIREKGLFLISAIKLISSPFNKVFTKLSNVSSFFLSLSVS